MLSFFPTINAKITIKKSYNDENNFTTRAKWSKMHFLKKLYIFPTSHFNTIIKRDLIFIPNLTFTIACDGHLIVSIAFNIVFYNLLGYTCLGSIIEYHS